jgi:D-alanyl-D-alanine carboxypeptidase
MSSRPGNRRVRITLARSLPACRFADETTKAPYDDWSLALVDPAFRLPPAYEPPDLVPVSRAGLVGSGSIRKVVIADLRALVRRARREHISLTARSTYRSERRQSAVFRDWVRASGRTSALSASARPGHSEHQLGTTIDFGVGTSAPWSMDFGTSTTGRWLATHAIEYGFAMSYPVGASNLTCYQPEPWHFRWIGRDRAAAFEGSGLTLREWLWRQTFGRG